MILFEFLTALVIGLVVVAAFGALFDRRGPWARPGEWSGALWFFLVVFLGAWAVGAWSTPVGPTWAGVAWLPFLFAALVLGSLMAALSEPRPVTPTEARAEAAAATVGVFFWLLILLLLLAITAAAVI